MTALLPAALLPAVLILSVVAVYLTGEHRLRTAVVAQDVRDRDAVAVAWVGGLSPARMQALAETLTALAPFAAALAAVPVPRLSRWRRVRWWVADRWERAVNDAVGGGSVGW